ncbi:MAG TPA: toast rack family protein [Anaerolineaceae bacterium]|nr:toast rack family protein [Anaerolineaceae bacterium]
MKRQALLALTVLVLASLACSINIDPPTINIPDVDNTGPTETFVIDEPAPADGSQTDLTIEMGAGEMNINPGTKGVIDGSVVYNVADWAPKLDRNGSSLRLTQDPMDRVTLDDDIKNEWNLNLGLTTPIDLTLKAGAYQAKIDLSGVPLTGLDISDGASDAKVEFNELNPAQMSRLTYRTGASQVELVGLANANFSELDFESGAGNYTLDFSGQLQQDAHASVKSGVSQVTIIIPAGMRARVINTASLSNVELDGSWNTNDETYETNGEGSLLTIDVNMGVGNLRLVQK